MFSVIKTVHNYRKIKRLFSGRNREGNLGRSLSFETVLKEFVCLGKKVKGKTALLGGELARLMKVDEF